MTMEPTRRGFLAALSVAVFAKSAPPPAPPEIQQAIRVGLRTRAEAMRDRNLPVKVEESDGCD
jgi:hypothetical protein